jgi:predicted SprT family Zn-dependent metalloprotease
MFYPLPNLIQLNPKDPEIGHSQAGVEQTFCHELTHSILYAMGELKLYANEKFVDLFGHLLHQALTTQEFK